jgi:hypothetical protein
MNMLGVPKYTVNTLPYKLRLQGNTSIVEDLQEQNRRTLKDYSRRLQDQLEYLPASGCFKYS